LISSHVILDVVGLSQVSQRDRPHDVFHVVVDLYKVLKIHVQPCVRKVRLLY
jgi:hypothetical protein